MRPFILLVVCTFLALAAAWSKEDHEIFRLRDEVETAEGQAVTFYDFLGISPSASQSDIDKAYRKKSKTLHPDKVKHNFIASRSTAKPNRRKVGEKKVKPGVYVSKGPSQREIQKAVKEASDRFSRLGIVANILRGSERERYDHFLKNGFPTWRGTGYYYSRYRPGLGSVLVGLFITGGGAAHYGALLLSWHRQREFVDRYIRHARRAAWGDETGIKGIPGLSGSGAVPPPAAVEEDETGSAMPMNRRQKRQMEKESKKEKSGKGAKPGGRSSGTQTPSENVAPTGERKRVVAENGKVLIVDASGNVFLEEEAEDGTTQEFLLDIEEIPKPTIRDTAVYRLPLWIYDQTVGRFQRQGLPDSGQKELYVDNDAEEEADSIAVVPADSGSRSDQDSGSSFEIVSAGAQSSLTGGSNGTTRKRNKKAKK